MYVHCPTLVHDLPFFMRSGALIMPDIRSCVAFSAWSPAGDGIGEVIFMSDSYRTVTSARSGAAAQIHNGRVQRSEWRRVLNFIPITGLLLLSGKDNRPMKVCY